MTGNPAALKMTLLGCAILGFYLCVMELGRRVFDKQNVQAMDEARARKQSGRPSHPVEMVKRVAEWFNDAMRERRRRVVRWASEQSKGKAKGKRTKAQWRLHKLLWTAKR